MDSLRKHLVRILHAAALAVAAVFLLVALLTLDNPVALAILLATGFASSALVFAVGVVVECAEEVRFRTRRMQGDVRVQTKLLAERESPSP